MVDFTPSHSVDWHELLSETRPYEAVSRSLTWEELLSMIAEYETLDRINFTTFNSSSVAALDLSYRSLGGALFDGMSLNHLHADGAKLVGAQFKSTNLEGASFAGADLRGANFSGANISYVDFSDAILDGATFSSCIGVESAKLPKLLQKKLQWSDPAVRRFILRKYGLVALVIGAASLPLTAAIWRLSPIGFAQQELKQANSQLADVQRQTAELKADQGVTKEQLKQLQHSVASEQQLLDTLKTESWKTRASKVSGTKPLSHSDKFDIANGLNSLMFKTDTSVQEFVMYFQILDWIEREYGSSARLAVVDQLLSINPSANNSLALQEFIRLSATVHGVVSPAQMEIVFREYFAVLDSNPSDREAFWSRSTKSWREYWISYFKEAGIL